MAIDLACFAPALADVHGYHDMNDIHQSSRELEQILLGLGTLERLVLSRERGINAKLEVILRRGFPELTKRGAITVTHFGGAPSVLS